MITVLPSSSAARRAWVCGESGLALIVRARRQRRWLESFSAASLAPAKLGIRPSAPGNRETPSRSIAFQIAFRTWSLERTERNIVVTDHPTPICHNGAFPVAPERTSLARPLESDEPTAPGDDALLPA